MGAGVVSARPTKFLVPRPLAHLRLARRAAETRWPSPAREVEADARFRLRRPTPGAFLGGLKSGSWEIISTINISLIFFLQGVSLKTDEMKAALKAVKARGCRGGPPLPERGRASHCVRAPPARPQALSYAVVAILGITACYGFILFNIPFRPDEFRYGAALFCVVPTTLTSGVLLASGRPRQASPASVCARRSAIDRLPAPAPQVTQAGGNSTLALMLTAGTNILGVVTSPFFLKAVISSRGVAANATLNPVNLLVKLLITVLAPCMAGKVLRELSKAVQELVKKHKTAVSLTTNFLLIMIVWMQVSKVRTGREDHGGHRNSPRWLARVCPDADRRSD